MQKKFNGIKAEKEKRPLNSNDLPKKQCKKKEGLPKRKGGRKKGGKVVGDRRNPTGSHLRKLRGRG